MAPVGAETFLAVRPAEDGLRVILRATLADFDRFERLLRNELTTLDAALIGYLPSPGHLLSIAGAPAMPREDLRALLFPDGRFRLAEELGTPLGRSGFICLPLFADELATTPDLATRTAEAVEYAATLGARTVSLAGMIPSLTGYGFDVARRTRVPRHDRPRRHRRLGRADRAGRAGRAVAADLTVAFVGLGSIGRTSLALLLAVEDRPKRLLLCDSGARLEGLHPDAEICGPDAVYEADLIVTAVSSHGVVIDVDRLRPGTIVVDDSFPHCFDVAKALAREDVIVVGGGLLAMPGIERRLAEDVPAPWLPGTIASCRLESLIDLPVVHGLVEPDQALAYWEAMRAAGVRAAPLHLAGKVRGGRIGGSTSWRRWP